MTRPSRALIRQRFYLEMVMHMNRVLVDPNYTERVNRMIAIRGTGRDVEMALSADRFIGTIQTSGGALVWHLFDGGER